MGTRGSKPAKDSAGGDNRAGAGPSVSGSGGGSGGGSSSGGMSRSSGNGSSRKEKRSSVRRGKRSKGAGAGTDSDGDGEVDGAAGSGYDTAGTDDAQTNPNSDDEGSGEMHPSWNDTELYSSGVTKDDFELMTVIGKGSFGKVMQVKKKDTGAIYAMKVLRKEAIIARKQVAHTRAEKSILEKIQHPFIVKLHYAFQTRDKLYMIMDFVNGGELFFHLKKDGRFAENRVKFYAAEIVCAIGHLHSLGVVYRDLKPENILLNAQGHVTITDFGLSKQINDGDTTTFCGTPEYLAPEVLKGQGHGKAVDWWSLGTLMYEMLTGLPPFYSQNINIMYQKILNGELRFPSYVSAEAQSVLEGLLTRRVEDRLGSRGLDDIHTHPFFREIDWGALERRETEPPFKPSVSSETDVTQIDAVFTQEKPMDSLVEGSAMDGAGDKGDDTFDGFTFRGDSAMPTS